MDSGAQCLRALDQPAAEYQYLPIFDITGVNQMPNVHLTRPMEAYARNQIRSGAYANLSEVVRAGVRLLMERDGARQFYALKEDLQEAVREAEAGGFDEFDPEAFEPDSDTR